MVITTKRAAAPTAQTQLKIKTGAVKRLVKEREIYVKEIADQQVRVEEYHQRAVNETDANKRKTYDADLRKQNEVLEETVQMVPHMERRIRDAMQDLENLVLAMQDSIEDVEALDSAREAIAAAADVVTSSKAKPV
ncbi:hypothetical protein IW146_007085 [Coemansia sp. RSA 922]|nr:hypothetical protein LPJ71_009688 [Coemansia sp. S17]KAJ2015479.1 hypothetical protein GGI14_004253 [Coemansia sp. S680]KAJ2035217.1 hypothetical protein H4S03_004460 [Coemansia sp. S3946]KAJ2037412.1 hypothetical protein H4S04_008582 [Coemansia sp. S16]KAJ2046046.1 hypothetical protein GGI08_006644 [Coemansia sp. S2]KAJ2070589.1 hypothetical protein GGH13_003922 [Coemansia sp. S155-1]KAJ2085567.1 hypothetical protein GGI09_006854 [Coemansia sp. S100]KAJ2107915.1 hypothetical protein IW14